MGRLILISMLCLWAASTLRVEGGDPIITFEWKVTYGDVAPLGVPVKGYTSLKKILDSGRNLGRADGLHINGKNAKGDGKDEPLFTMEAGKTYRYRFCNPGLKTAVNVRFQDHTMKLVEMEGSHTVQNIYESLDLHVGMCFTVLVTADKEPRDYFLVASSRFTKRDLTATGIVRYLNGKGAPKPDLPKPPVGWACIETGTWSPEKRMNYNLLDAMSRHTIQMFPVYETTTAKIHPRSIFCVQS
ncbi:hypothetical protein V6N13_031030 [Hibiscus sabdariffa]